AQNQVARGAVGTGQESQVGPESAATIVVVDARKGRQIGSGNEPTSIRHGMFEGTEGTGPKAGGIQIVGPAGQQERFGSAETQRTRHTIRITKPAGTQDVHPFDQTQGRDRACEGWAPRGKAEAVNADVQQRV